MATACRLSLFQLARAYTVFARDGELVPVTLLKTDAPAAGVRVLQPQTAQAVRHMLHLAPAPAAPRPRRRPWAIRWAARPAPRTSRKARATPSNKYRGFFVGIAPIDKPRIVVAVMIDEPSAGRVLRRRRRGAGVQRHRAADACACWACSRT